MSEITFKQIGIIHSPFQTPEEAPIQAIRSDANGVVEIFPQYVEGLLGINEFSHLFLFYFWHKAIPAKNYLVTPFLDDQKHGIFSTRYPSRPNPLGFSVVKLCRVEDNLLHISGVDVLDQTPLLDIKPYVPDFDHFDPTQIGWYGRRAFK